MEKKTDVQSILKESQQILHHCGFCYKTDVHKKCSKCKKVYYCSVKCQKKDWKKYKNKNFKNKN